VEPADSLALIAELAVALVAAAGIVTAIGGRGRDYTPLDRVTIRGLVIVSATPLAIALLGLVLLSAEVPTARAWSAASFGYIALIVARNALALPDSIRLRAQDQSISRLGLALPVALSSGMALLLLYNAVTLAAIWPILVACSYDILIAVRLILALLIGSRQKPATSSPGSAL
jgi:hypothetical protein